MQASSHQIYNIGTPQGKGTKPVKRQRVKRKSRRGEGRCSQRLLPKKDSKGRVAACEIMVSTELIRECIADKDRIAEIREYIAKGNSTVGSQTFDQALVAHYRAGLISEETVYEYATNPADVKLLLSGISR